jgi:hypothetical protein
MPNFLRLKHDPDSISTDFLSDELAGSGISSILSLKLWGNCPKVNCLLFIPTSTADLNLISRKILYKPPIISIGGMLAIPSCELMREASCAMGF